jgi:hypothetical protein
MREQDSVGGRLSRYMIIFVSSIVLAGLLLAVGEMAGLHLMSMAQ